MSPKSNNGYGFVDFSTINNLQPPTNRNIALFMDVKDFAVEGDHSAALAIVNAYKLGWKRLITFDWAVKRFYGALVQ